MDLTNLTMKELEDLQVEVNKALDEKTRVEY